MSQSLRRLAAYLALAVLLGPAASAYAAPAVETVVLIRHGEKPPGGEGRLDCQGLNRADRLPAVLAAAFDRPAAIFAPDPAQQKVDEGVSYDYRRPLQTVQPTARALGMTVDTRFGYRQIADLQKALEAPEYSAATVIVAWEHKELVALARALMAANGGSADVVPKWKGRDFDSIYVVRITRDDARTGASFELRKEGLDGQPKTCAER